jgi:hypothetical protein
VIRKGQGSGNLLPSDFSAAALSHGQEEDTTLEPFVWAQKCRVTRVGGMIGGNPKEPILEGVTGSEREKSQIMEELIGIWGGTVGGGI